MALSTQEINILVNVRANEAIKQINALDKHWRSFTVGTVKDGTSVMDTYKRKGHGYYQMHRRLQYGVKRFKMEWLGIMFAGMAMNRMFAQWTKQAKDMTGVTELFGATMSLITLQGLLPFLDTIYASIQGLMDLDEGTKRTIGIFMLLGEAFGGFLMFAGQMILAFSSLAMVFPAMRMAAIGAISAILTVISPIMGKVFEGVEGLEGLKSAFMAVQAAAAGGVVYEGFKIGKELVQTVKVQANMAPFAQRISNMPTFLGDLIRKHGWHMLGGAIMIGSIINLSNKIATGGATPHDYMDAIAQVVGGALVAWAPSPIGKAIGITLVLIPTLAPGAIGEVVDNIIRGAQRVWEAVSTGKFPTEYEGIPFKYQPVTPFFGDVGTTEEGFGGGIGTLTFSPTINITASSNVDIDVLKSQLNEEWRDEIDSMMR